ncbi:MAG: dihydropteroate synthase [Leptospiraceae bacterium]|nr:dihydropteroate synthase [Leptospiraceae bacterium]
MNRTSSSPRLLGIVNITTDSFSDGGQFLSAPEIESHILSLCATGCPILDLGAASSNPQANPVEANVEIQRLDLTLGIIRKLKAEGRISKSIEVSVDSFNPEVQKHVLREGIDYLNDITGFAHPAMYDLLAESDCKMIVMHSLQKGIANEMHVSPDSILDRIRSFFEERLRELEAAGISPSNLILDPGMGFFLGSDAECSYRVLRNLQTLRKDFALPLLVSVSRKSFLGAITGKPPRDRFAATLACELYLAEQKVEYIRTHDPAPLYDALAIQNAIHGGHLNTDATNQS